MKRGNSGVTMIEIAVGVIILALILIPAMNVISGETKAVVSTKDYAQAVFIAQQVMEKARTFPFEALDMDRDGLSTQAKEITYEFLVKNKDEYNAFNVNGLLYKVNNFDIRELGSKFDSDPKARKAVALLAFEVEFTGKDKKKHVMEFHTAISQQN